MPETVLISHERSLRSEAMDVALLVVMLTFLQGCALALWWYSGFPRLDSMLVFLAAVTGFIFTAALSGHAVLKARDGGRFRCMLTTERIVCEYPAESRGESFALKIEEIAFIEIKQFAGSNFGGDYYLHDLKGREYWLTLNYSNPAARILDRLEVLNPKIKLINHED